MAGALAAGCPAGAALSASLADPLPAAARRDHCREWRAANIAAEHRNWVRIEQYVHLYSIPTHWCSNLYALESQYNFETGQQSDLRGQRLDVVVREVKRAQ